MVVYDLKALLSTYLILYADITISTLRTLTDSPNPNIVNSATGLIVSRTLRHQATITSIRQDLRSPDPATRRLATLAFDFLRQHKLYDRSLDAPTRVPYNDWNPPESAPDFDAPRRRRGGQSGDPWTFGAPEDGVTGAEHARQISEMIDRRRRPSGSDHTSDANHNPLTGRYARQLSERVRARLERERAEGLADGTVSGEINPWVDEGGRERDLVPSVEDPVAGWTNVPRARPQRAGMTEAELRRQRREAVVINVMMEELYEWEGEAEGEEEAEEPPLDEEDLAILARRIERETRRS